MTEKLCVFAIIRPKPEYLADAKAAIVSILGATRAEPGCLRFTLHEGRGDGCLYLYEEWSGQEALDEHYQQPYTRAVFGSYQDWLAQPVEVTKMTECG